MKFVLRGLARGRGEAAEIPSASAESVTRLSPARKRLGAKATRRLMDKLTAQQASLIRAVVLSEDGYLNRSFYTDSETGKRIAYELEEDELTSFATTWGLAPVDCIRSMNKAMSKIYEPSRLDRYVRAAVDLEILMDRENWTNGDGLIYQGIPPYLMNGYTDMGTLPSPTERNGREKIKVDKVQMKERLVELKRDILSTVEPAEKILARFYDAVRQDIEFNEQGVERLSKEYGNESIVLSEYLDKGMGVCRHLSICLQLYLQEAGIESRVVKGNLRFYVFTGRHAWNIVRLGEQVALVDVTHPNVNRPFILLGSPENNVYKRAQEFARSYIATPDEQNFYKIGAP